MFRCETVLEEIAWAKMVILLKGKGEYQGIWMVEVLWKVGSVVVNCCFKMSVVLYDTLHGFREGWGTRTATLESKLAHHLDRLTHKPLIQVLLNICKSYDFMDRRRCLEILRRY